jgi:glycosyltransferase involved in cell wall biosynthesis
MPDRPAVSVAIVTRQQAHYLGEAIESVLAQTFDDFEIIVCDDASTDAAADVAAAYGDRVRYIRHPQQRGVAAARNSCLAVARGRFIAWLDSDDAYHSHMLEAQSRVLESDSDVLLVHGGFEVMDAGGRRLADWPPPFDHDVVETGTAALRELLLANYVTAPTVMVRRELYDRVGGYLGSLRRSSEDWQMWLRAAAAGHLAFTARRVARYRVHPASLSATTATNGVRLRADVVAVKTFLAKHRSAVPRVVERRAYAALATKALLAARQAFAADRRATACSLAATALRLAPSLLRGREAPALLTCIARGDEYGQYVHSRALLARLYQELAGTRFGARVEKFAVADEAWNRTLRATAETVRRVVPRDGVLASVDKHDPTLLSLSGRRGRHFPDSRLLPEGYPPDDAAAIAHLQELQRRGVSHIVFPQSAFWWLDHYVELAQHLEGQCRPLWKDETCRIYDVRPAR